MCSRCIKIYPQPSRIWVSVGGGALGIFTANRKVSVQSLWKHRCLVWFSVFLSEFHHSLFLKRTREEQQREGGEQGAAREWPRGHRGTFGLCPGGKGKPPKHPRSKGAARHGPPFVGITLALMYRTHWRETSREAGCPVQGSGWLECAEAAGVTRTGKSAGVQGTPRHILSRWQRGSWSRGLGKTDLNGSF